MSMLQNIVEGKGPTIITQGGSHLRVGERARLSNLGLTVFKLWFSDEVYETAREVLKTGEYCCWILDLGPGPPSDGIMALRDMGMPKWFDWGIILPRSWS
jgi:hypothetical protein